MPTALTYEEQVRNAMKIYRAVAVFKGQMWEDDEKQVALMAMVEGAKACKLQYSLGTQAVYIQQYVRGRLQSFRKGLQRRVFEPETWTDRDGEVQMAEAPVEPAQEEALQHREECERVARAIQQLPRVERETIAMTLNNRVPVIKEKARQSGVSMQAFGQRRTRAIARLRELVGEGNS